VASGCCWRDRHRVQILGQNSVWVESNGRENCAGIRLRLASIELLMSCQAKLFNKMGLKLISFSLDLWTRAQEDDFE
jgi:hypothetical protein